MKTHKPNFLILLICFLAFSFNAKAQTYDPYAVQVINNLIANNGLNATPNAPETWEFATWNGETPKQIIGLSFRTYNYVYQYIVSGDVQLAGLTALKNLYYYFYDTKSQLSNPKEEETIQNRMINKLNLANCISLQTLSWMSEIGLNEIDLTNCSQLLLLNLQCNLTKLDVSDCTQLKELWCLDNHLNQIDLTNCSQLQTLYCNNNHLNQIDLKNCSQLKILHCDHNKLSELDINDCSVLDDFKGDNQEISLALLLNNNNEYTCTISLNEPIFGNGAISYFEGILKSTDNSVLSTSFIVQTGKSGFELSGTMNFTYSNVGINTSESIQPRVYPNPAKAIIHFENTNNIDIISGSLINIYGQIIKQFEPNITQINISNIPSGIYFVKFSTSNGNVIQKISINQ